MKTIIPRAIHKKTFSCEVAPLPEGLALYGEVIAKPLGTERVNHSEMHFWEEKLSSRPVEWSLFPWLFDAICKVFIRPHIDLFSLRTYKKIALYMSSIPDPMAWKQDAFQHPWDNLCMYTFSPFTLLRQILLRVMLSTNLLMIMGSSSLASEGVVCKSVGSLVEELLKTSMR